MGGNGWRWVAVAVVLAASGCDDHVFPNVGGGDETAYTPTFEGFEGFFGDHCEGCHPSLNAWDVDQTVADINSGAGRFVVPGDPDASLLWRVITDADDRVALMPLGNAQPLDASVTGHIRQWILDGASLE